MAFYENFTASLKQKWLEYFQKNRAWLILQMEIKSVKTPDSGRRPGSSLILGVINALEPKLANLMVPFYKLNPDEDALVDVLGLNFDPDKELLSEESEGAQSSVKESSGVVSGLLPDRQDKTTDY
ncbi:MAG: DUF5331 domain-containing protein [Hormoscilla sp. GM7CHS1pb]|nr:DUF5331 domain-containing protein [Hormoscilla sp. GM7CHS1pb]